MSSEVMLDKHEGFATLNEKFQSTVKEKSDSIALIYQEEKLSFAELDQLVDKLAGALYSKGMRKQDKAIIYLPHLSQWVITWLALQRIGAVAVPVSHFYEHVTLHYIAVDSGAETIFCIESNLQQVKLALPGSSLKEIIVVDGEESAFKSFLAGEAPPLPSIEIQGKDIAEILYTSGTTGLPKGVPIANVLLLEQIEQAKIQCEQVVSRGKGITIQGAPLNHILGQELGLGSLLSGDTLILLPKMDLDVLLEHIEKYQANIFFGTPTLCRMILEHEGLAKHNAQSLIYVFTGGEALPAEVAKKWQEKFGKPLYNGYGSTETSGGIAGIIAGKPFPEGTSGKIVSNKKIKLVNSETLEPVPEGEAGELLVCSQNMTTGYWNSPEETAKRFINLDGSIWYRTGDVVHIDKEGWLFFKERSLDMIKHKGYRVAPSKIEGVLYKHHAVSSCCAVGVPDEKVGEKIKVFVVLKKGIENVAPGELIEWCRERLVSYEIPHYIEFKTELPKSQSGKILRKVLRDEVLAAQSAS